MPEPSRDWFRILELPPDASMDAIKRSYRSLVKLWHPDRYAPGSSMQTVAQEKIKYINQAYAEVCKIRGREISKAAASGSSVRSAYASAETGEAERRASHGRPETAGTPPPRPKRTPETAPPPPKRTPETASAPPRPSRPVETAEAEAAASPPPPRAGAAPKSTLRPRNRPIIWPFVLALVSGGAFVAILLAMHGRQARASVTPATVFSSPTLAALAASASTVPQAGPPPRAQEAVASADTERSAGVDDVSGPATTEPHAHAYAPEEELRPAASAAGLSQAGSARAIASLSTPQGLPAAAPGALMQATIEAAARDLDAFSVGSSREDVIKLQGPPDEATPALLRYGNSVVYLSGNKVSSWRQIDVVLRSRVAIDLAYDQAASFGVGSTKADVLRVQGKPDHFSDSVFQYGSSTVQFFQGRVVSWKQGVPPLKARLFGELAYGRAATFSVGSTRAQVLDVQGKPDSATDALLRYGAAVIHFENGRVVAWQDPLGILRARVTPHLPDKPKA